MKLCPIPLVYPVNSLPFLKMHRFLLPLLSCVLGFSALSAEPETITRRGYKLIVDVQDEAFPPAIKDRMVETFFIVYPRMSADFNRKSPREVYFIIRKMDGVAYASGGKIHFSSDWMQKSCGNDIDVVTHETMHLVQSYRNGNPMWVTEGIADYARHKYGVDNKGSGWAMPNLQKNHKYTDAYRVTARFFVWLENRANRQLIRRLDTAMRDGKYAEAFWKEQTGHDLDTLWACYQKAPELTGGLVNLNKLAEEITKEKGK